MISTLLGTVLIPVVIAVVSQSYTAALKENEIGLKYVELSISILKSEPKSNTRHLRSWAIDVINHHSQVHLPPEAVTELRNEDLSNLLKALHDMSMVPIKNIR